MKKQTIILLLIIFSLNFISCELKEDESEIVETETEWRCGTHNGNELWTGPQGGCYYYNSNGNKTYVDRSECDC